MRSKIFPILLLFSLFINACTTIDEPIMDNSAETPVLIFSTPTLAATSTQQPTNTPRLPTQTPTYTPVSASLTAQINLRAEPSADSDALGLLNFGTEVFVIGRSADKNWLALREPMPNVAIGWISVKYVSLSEDLIDQMRVIDNTSSAQTSANNPILTPQQSAAPNTATTTVELNVRSGPASTFDQIATIPANTTVNITGKNQTEIWTRVELPLTVGGYGWVASQYLEGGNYAILPYYDAQGNLIVGQTTSNPPNTSGNLTPNAPESGNDLSGYAPATNDNDSFEAPLGTADFGPAGVKRLEIHNTVSSPTGDREDWIRFTPYQAEGSQATLIAAIQCVGNGAITLQLFRENTGNWEGIPLTCGVYDFAINGQGGFALTLHISADGSAGDVRLVEYTLTLESE